MSFELFRRHKLAGVIIRGGGGDARGIPGPAVILEAGVARGWRYGSKCPPMKSSSRRERARGSGLASRSIGGLGLGGEVAHGGPGQRGSVT